MAFMLGSPSIFFLMEAEERAVSCPSDRARAACAGNAMGGDLKGGGVAQLLVCSRVAQDACEYGDLLK